MKVKQFQDYTLYTTPNRSQTGWSLLPYPSEDKKKKKAVNIMVILLFTLLCTVDRAGGNQPVY